jgi:hypothetical protein
MARVTSNKPFNRQCNVRKGAGPIYNKFCPPEQNSNNVTRTRIPEKNPCFGEYDNLVAYVFEIDFTGNHLAYVDCDYVE